MESTGQIAEHTMLDALKTSLYRIPAIKKKIDSRFQKLVLGSLAFLVDCWKKEYPDDWQQRITLITTQADEITSTKIPERSDEQEYYAYYAKLAGFTNGLFKTITALFIKALDSEIDSLKQKNLQSQTKESKDAQARWEIIKKLTEEHVQNQEKHFSTLTPSFVIVCEDFFPDWYK